MTSTLSLRGRAAVVRQPHKLEVGCATQPPATILESRCAWCDKENGVKPQPHHTHTICPRHKAMMLVRATEINTVK